MVNLLQQEVPGELPVTFDTVDAMSGLTPESPTFALRHRRAKIALHTQLSEDALLDPSLPDISLAERLFVAWYAAFLTDVPAVASHYHARLITLGDRDAMHAVQRLTAASIATSAAESKPDSSTATQAVSGGIGSDAAASMLPPRWAAIAAHTRLLTLHLVRAQASDLQTLADVGLTTFAIVVLSQLVAFISYQTRLVSMLSAMHRATHGLAETAADRRDIVGSTGTVGTVGIHSRAYVEDLADIESKAYTFSVLEWQAWRDVVTLEQASPDQVAVLTESHPKAKTSDYYLLLVHAPEILRQRSAVFNAIMYQPGGLARAERELGATVVSRINGCVYCASVHAQRFEQLAKRRDSIEQVFADPLAAGISAREQALVRFSIDLTRAPGAMGPVDIHTLRDIGFNDAEILDLAHSIAIFAWANRLMLTLGEPVWESVE